MSEILQEQSRQTIVPIVLFCAGSLGIFVCVFLEKAKLFFPEDNSFNFSQIS